MAVDSRSWPAGALPDPALYAEDERARVLAAYDLGESGSDSELDAIAAFAARLCEAPVALVTMVEPERQRFIGRAGTELEETPRSTSFCAHAMLGAGPMTVPDARADPRFADNPLVTGAPHVRFYTGAPLVSPEGVPLGALCIIDTAPRPEGLNELQRDGLALLARSVMERLEATRRASMSARELAQREQRMRALSDWLPDIIWSADSAGSFDYFNKRWRDVTGAKPPRATGDWVAHVHPDDVEAVRRGWEKSFGKGKPFSSEYRLRQADGEWRWTLSRALPVKDESGSVRWYGTLTDIDDSRRLSDNRDLLARELSHRIKNIFAVVSGLIALRAGKHTGAKAFAGELVGAIRALGRAHDFVRPIEGDKGDSLRGLLAELMAPYQDGRGNRVLIEGGDCRIGSRAAAPLALVFHELATNSAKYGALSADGGEVAISLDCPDGDDIARVHWRERGGPRLGEVNADGFGSRLIAMSVEGQLAGRLERRFEPEGFELDLELKSSVIRS